MGSSTSPHEHRWYAISWDPVTHEPLLWGCGVYWRCSATRTREWKGRGRAKALVGPEDTMPTPYGGLWGHAPADSEE